MTTVIEELTPSAFEALTKLNSDMKAAARLMGRRSVRSLVDLYYQLQEFRKRTSNQLRSAGDGEPDMVIEWADDNMRRLEGNIRKALGEFAAAYNVGQWLQSITGIGPVISAGLLAHLDIRRAKTCGHFWRFAGLDPTVKWESKQKRPWNAQLKTLVVYKAGECFVKFQNHKDDYYGKLFKQRRILEGERNERGEFKAEAERALTEKAYRRETQTKTTYESGRLPDAHLHARARRYVVKLFVSHVHHAMYVDYFGDEPPVPYAFEKCPGDHRHFVPLPNWPFEGNGKSLRELFDSEASRVE